ncbi:lonely Cys domain-containing protein [Streptomyces lydicus]|nr:lonely Cys domain-containing protein [Streptomyces lydicus]
MRSALRLGTERAEAARDEFLDELDDELADRQSGVPAELRLHASDFVTRATGQVRLPEGDPVIAALVGTAGAADIERQATLEFLYDPETAAVETLDKLRGQDRRLDGKPLDLDAATRQILHLPEDAEVSAEQRAEMYALCWEAREEGRATSRAALAVFHLERRLGVLAPDRKRHFTQGMSAHRTHGLNWSERPVTGLDTTRLRTRDLDGSTTYTEHWSGVPWRKTPQAYVVAGDMRDGKYVVRLDDDREVLIDFEEFAELVALDVRRQKPRRGTPVVLAIPFAGDGLLDGPRLLADRTGMTVFAHSAEVGLAQPDGKESTVLVIRRKGERKGEWIPSRRGLALDPLQGDPMAEFRDVQTQAIISDRTGEQIGRRSFHRKDLVDNGFEEASRHLDTITEAVHYNPVTNTYSAPFTMPAPGPLSDAFFEDFHADPRGPHLALRNGASRALFGREPQKRWHRRKSVLERPRPWMDIQGCATGDYRDVSVPSTADSHTNEGKFTADPLAQVPYGQRIANDIEQPVRATTCMDTLDTVNGRRVRVLFTDFWGREGRIVIFLPEPKGAELDRLAGVVGWHDGSGEASAEVRLRVLRGVRALRLVFGWNVKAQAEAARQGGYEELLRGFAALDDMWRADDRFTGLGRFTMDLFHRVVAARSEGGADPDQGAYRAVLAAAGTQQPGTSLRDFVPGLPDAVDRAVAWTSGADLADEAAAALRTGADRVGTAHHSRMFWARVKAEETLETLDVDALLPMVLGIDPAVDPNDALRAQVTTAFTYAYAAGWDASDPDVVGAHRLERLGAQSEDTLLRAAYTDETLTALKKEREDNEQSGQSEAALSTDLYDSPGRDFGPGPKPDRVDLSQVHTPWGLGKVRWTSPKDHVASSPSPLLVRGAVDPRDPAVVRVRLNGTDHDTPLDVFLELLAADREFMKQGPQVPLVLCLNGLGPDAKKVARRFADRLARTVWWTEYEVDLSEKGDSGLPVLTVQAPPGSTVPPDGGWRRRLPRSVGQTGPSLAVPPPCRTPAAVPPTPTRAGPVPDPSAAACAAVRAALGACPRRMRTRRTSSTRTRTSRRTSTRPAGRTSIRPAGRTPRRRTTDAPSRPTRRPTPPPTRRPTPPPTPPPTPHPRRRRRRRRSPSSRTRSRMPRRPASPGPGSGPCPCRVRGPGSRCPEWERPVRPRCRRWRQHPCRPRRSPSRSRPRCRLCRTRRWCRSFPSPRCSPTATRTRWGGWRSRWLGPGCATGGWACRCRRSISAATAPTPCAAVRARTGRRTPGSPVSSVPSGPSGPSCGASSWSCGISSRTCRPRTG